MSILSARIFFIIPCFLFLNGCFLAPAIDSFKQLGVTEGDRKNMLEDHVRDFNEALYWGKKSEALAYVAEPSREKIRAALRAKNRKERIVDNIIELVDFRDEAQRAEVEVRVKYYEVPYYTVKERLEEQVWTWEFSRWMLLEREIIQE